MVYLIERPVVSPVVRYTPLAPVIVFRYLGVGLAVGACNGTQHVRADRDHLVNARACICKAQCNAIQLLNY